MKTVNHLLYFLVLISSSVLCQEHWENVSDLKGKTKYYNAVDKWVVWNKDNNRNTISYGFIYLDNSAGFTYHYVGKAELADGKFKNIDDELDDVSIKARIEPNSSLVFVLTKNMLKDLELPDAPDWLSVYKKGSETVEYLKNEGYHYNHAGASALALKPLLKGYIQDPHYKQLEFELGYAHNALGQFNEASIVLEKAIVNDPDNFYFYKELGYAYRYLGQIKKAENTYKKGIAISNNDFEKSEMAVNMAQHYFLAKEKKPFKKWSKLVRKYSKKGQGYAKFIDTFEKEWDNDQLRKVN